MSFTSLLFDEGTGKTYAEFAQQYVKTPVGVSVNYVVRCLIFRVLKYRWREIPVAPVFRRQQWRLLQPRH